MQIRRNFNRVTSRRISDSLCDVRKNGKQPNYLVKDVYDALVKQWDTEDYQKKCQQNQKNRLSDPDGMGISKHCGGSIPFTAREKKYIKEKGYRPSFEEFYLYNHKKADGTFVDATSEHVWNEYRGKFDEFMKANPLSGPLPTRELDPARAKIFVDNFTDANGTVYGFGAKGTNIKRLAGLREDQSLDDIEPRSFIMRLNEELDGKTMQEFVTREIQRQSSESQGLVIVENFGSRNGRNKDKAIKKAKEKNKVLKASFKNLFKYVTSKKAGSSKSKRTVIGEDQNDDEFMQQYADLMQTSSEEEESE